MAYSDAVTGLANRQCLVEAIEALHAAGTGSCTLLFLDLDNFKKVNDLHGHPVGDRLLRHVGSALRAMAPLSLCCARLGGDEFAVLLSSDADPQEATAVAQRILERLAQPVNLDGTTAYVSASIGLARFTADDLGPEAVLRRSDIAMYEAKRLGRNRLVWFDSAMETKVELRGKIEAEMRQGVELGEFVPFYQPQHHLLSGELNGFEVLARWQHPERGLIEPSEFIGIAEASGLISALSLSVMRQALLEARDWPATMMLAVNISPVQFRDPLLSQRILKVLAETGFPSARLELEITESSIFADQEQALTTVESLKKHGISISLDDFGTGYASLTQLKSLPFDRIKIDRSFVAALLSDSQSRAIVGSIAALANSLELPVTAEGIETEDVRTRLLTLGCADGQGWLWSKALPAVEAVALLGRFRLSSSEEVGSEASELAPVLCHERRDNERRGWVSRRSA